MQLDEWDLFHFLPFNVLLWRFLAFATPHQSFLSIGSEVPIAKKSSFPPGEAKGEETLRFYCSSKYSIPLAGRRHCLPYVITV